MHDARQRWPATARNRDPIFEVLQRVLPASGLVLEIAAGSWEHAAHFAPRLPALEWQPTDLDPANLESVTAWWEHAGAPNLRRPLQLDVTADTWPLEQAAAIFNANMIHIAPWEVTRGLLSGAGRLLPAGAPLVMYGPYKRGGAHTAASNERFDRSLRERDPSWGVRDLDEVARVASDARLELEEVVSMPANNLIVLYRKR
jgi:hypothetical protein